MSTTFSATSMAARMENEDHDLRYMAVADLKRELEAASFRANERDGAKLVSATTALLGDSSRDVRALAVDTFPLLVGAYGPAAITPLVAALTGNLGAGAKDELRDVSALGLSVILSNLADAAHAPLVCELAIGPVVGALASDNADVAIRGLEVASALLAKFCALVVDAHTDLLTTLLALLGHSRETVRKNAVVCLGFLTAHLSAPLFDSLLDSLVGALENAASGAQTKTNVACLTAVVDIAGARVAPRIAAILPLAEKLLVEPAGRDHDMVAVEVTEAVLHLYGALVARCPGAVSAAVDSIVDKAVVYLAFDPNYAGGDDGSDSGSDSEYGGYDEYDDDEFSDDEDVSWKVRKASAKCLAAVIGSRPSALPAFYADIAPQLIARFSERQDAVQADVFDTFATLLKATAAVGAGTDLLGPLLPSAAAALAPQLTKSPRAREGGVALVAALAATLPGGLGPVLPTLVPKLVKILADAGGSSNAVRLAVAAVLADLLAAHPPAHWLDSVVSIADAAIPMVSDTNFKVIAGALAVLDAAVAALVDAAAADALSAGLAATVGVLKGESDRQVKVAALSALGSLVASAAPLLGADAVAGTLPLFVASVQNAIMDVRVAAVSALAAVFASVHARPVFDVGPAAEVLAAEFVGFLRKADRSLVLATIGATSALLEYAPAALESAALDLATTAVALIDAGDLGVAAQAAQLTTALVGAVPGHAAAIEALAMPQLFALLASAVLQGAALTQACALLVALAAAGTTPVGDMIAQLVAVGSVPDGSLPRQAFSSIAAAIGALVAAGGDVDNAVANFAGTAGTTDAGEPARILAFYALGHIGKAADTSGSADALGSAAMAAFGAESERVKAAAAYALGSLAVGAPDAYLPPIVGSLDGASAGTVYLLLTAVKEYVGASLRRGPGATVAHAGELWPALVGAAASDEVGTRNVVAESLGLLVASSPGQAGALAELTGADEPLVRAVAVAGLRTAVAQVGAGAFDGELGSALHGVRDAFFGLMSDEALEVRRGAVNTVAFLVSKALPLVRDAIPALLPALYAELPVKPELIRELKLGVVTIKVDDGEQNRKGALECFQAIIAHALDALDVHAFIPCVVEGMGEKNYDNKMLCNAILVALAHAVPSAIVEAMADIAAALNKLLKTRPRTKTAKDLEALETLVVSTLKTVIALNALAASHSLPAAWTEFEALVAEGKFADMYANGGASVAVASDGASASH